MVIDDEIGDCDRKWNLEANMLLGLHDLVNEVLEAHKVEFLINLTLLDEVLELDFKDMLECDILPQILSHVLSHNVHVAVDLLIV